MLGNINLVSADPFPKGWVMRNQESNRRAGHPLIEDAGPVAANLAVVGGSPGVVDHLDTIMRWDGEIWAINKTHQFLQGHGIASTFFTIDASEIIADWCAGAKRAVLGDSVLPEVFGRVGYAEMARLGPEYLPWGCSSAVCAPQIAATRGHKHVTFFGCESSFGEQTHADRDEETPVLIVECGGGTYRTSPGMLMQADTLAQLARACPSYITVVGGGLLAALVEHGAYEVTQMSRSLSEALT